MFIKYMAKAKFWINCSIENLHIEKNGDLIKACHVSLHNQKILESATYKAIFLYT